MADSSAAPTMAQVDSVRDEPTMSSTPENASDPMNQEFVRFIEFFAGDGGLTLAVRAAGVAADDPQDAASGGANFEDYVELEGVRAYLHELHSSGVKLILHFAPLLDF